MNEFWGVDDPEERKRLRKKALCATPFWTRVATTLKLIFVAASVAVLVSALLPGGLTGGFPVSSALAGGLGAWAVLRWEKQSVRRSMGKLLRAEGRCEYCGYKLHDEHVGRCSECGKPCE